MPSFEVLNWSSKGNATLIRPTTSVLGAASVSEVGQCAPMRGARTPSGSSSSNGATHDRPSLRVIARAAAYHSGHSRVVNSTSGATSEFSVPRPSREVLTFFAAHYSAPGPRRADAPAPTTLMSEYARYLSSPGPHIGVSFCPSLPGGAPCPAPGHVCPTERPAPWTPIEIGSP
jgi:hypothetical protein